MAFRIVLTDLDGTLLDRDTYCWEPARPALERLRAENVPCVFASSKTRAEIEYWRKEMGNTHPYIAENGAALVVPRNQFKTPPSGVVLRNGSIVVEWGTPYRVLVEVLATAARASGCRVRGFSAMDISEIARCCELNLEQARLAKLREYDEAFTVLDPERAGALRAAIEARGLRWTSGGRFEHLTGDNDKGRAVRMVLELYRRAHGDVDSIGLGDSLNDAAMLACVSLPVVMPSDRAEEVKRLAPRAAVAASAGPEGWNSAVLRWLDGH